MLPREGRAPRTKAQQLALAARTRAKNEHGLWAYRRRMVDAEGVIAELKNHHALDRVRCRGTPTFHVQLLLGCAAINPKRLAAHAPTAQQGVAAAPRAATAAPAPETTTWLVGISAAVVGVLSAWRRTWAARNENSDG